MAELVTEHDDLKPATSHILEAEVRPERPKRVRHAAILAADAGIELEDVDGDEGDARRRREAGGKIAGTVSGAGALNMRRAVGNGSLWLGRHGGDIAVIASDGTLVVLDQGSVLATDDALGIELDVKLPKLLAATRSATRAWSITGRGQIAMATNGEIVALEVESDRPFVVETEAVIAYTATIEFSAPADYESRLGKRAAKFVLANLDKLPGVGFSLSTGRERIWAVAEGEGTIFIVNQSE